MDVVTQMKKCRPQTNAVLPIRCKDLFGLLSLLLGLKDSMVLKCVSKDHKYLVADPLKLFLKLNLSSQVPKTMLLFLLMVVRLVINKSTSISLWKYVVSIPL